MNRSIATTDGDLWQLMATNPRKQPSWNRSGGVVRTNGRPYYRGCLTRASVKRRAAGDFVFGEAPVPTEVLRRVT